MGAVHFGALFRGIFASVSLLGMMATARAITLEQLQHDSALAPETFARHFAHFRFCFRPEVQSPQAFLSSKRGDCDDYATLAADLLKSKGFTPRLIAVRMQKIVHVVCYVEEAGAYLDYNRRAVADGLVHSPNRLTEIADKVAASFGLAWYSVSEFTYRDGLKRLVQTVLPPEPLRTSG